MVSYRKDYEKHVIFIMSKLLNSKHLTEFKEWKGNLFYFFLPHEVEKENNSHVE